MSEDLTKERADAYETYTKLIDRAKSTTFAGEKDACNSRAQNLIEKHGPLHTMKAAYIFHQRLAGNTQPFEQIFNDFFGHFGRETTSVKIDAEAAEKIRKQRQAEQEERARKAKERGEKAHKEAVEKEAVEKEAKEAREKAEQIWEENRVWFGAGGPGTFNDEPKKKHRLIEDAEFLSRHDNFAGILPSSFTWHIGERGEVYKLTDMTTEFITQEIGRLEREVFKQETISIGMRNDTVQYLIASLKLRIRVLKNQKQNRGENASNR